jgi:hypothetical protein
LAMVRWQQSAKSRRMSGAGDRAGVGP